MTATEFRLSDEQWREYQQMPEQGYSHRAKLEWFVNSWLAEHDRDVAESAWDAGFSYAFWQERGYEDEESHGNGVPEHLDPIEWNPHRTAQTQN